MIDSESSLTLWAVSIEFKVNLRHSEVQQRMCGLEGTRGRGTIKSKYFHLERGTKQGDLLSTLLFHSLPQHIMKSTAETWTRCIHGVRLVEHDPNTNLSDIRFAVDILVISDSLKHTTTIQDDFPTATTTHDLQLHFTKITIISNTTSKCGRSNTLTVEDVSIEICPSEGKNQILWSTHHFQKMSYKSSLNVASNTRAYSSGATDRSWAHHNTYWGTDSNSSTSQWPYHSSTYQERERWRRTWRRAPDNSTTNDEDDHTDKVSSR